MLGALPRGNKMRPQKYISILALAIVAGGLVAATMNYGRGYDMKKLTVSLTSDGSGDASEATATAYIPTVGSAASMTGKIYRVVTNPGDGASSPTAQWDVTISDADGVSLFGTDLNDRYSTNSQQVVPTTPVAFSGALTVTGENMGSTMSATVVIYFAP